MSKLYYCAKCGATRRLYKSDFENPDKLICVLCMGKEYLPVPEKYITYSSCGFPIINEDLESEFIEEVVKKSPNFDQSCFDSKDEIRAQRKRDWEDIKASAKERSLSPKCPICGSTNIKKISFTSRAVKTALFGAVGAIDDAGKTWKCNNCGSKF